jgi:tRNA A37 threonylcarbamoyladenosine biosynthesis protein TsaE
LHVDVYRIDHPRLHDAGSREYWGGAVTLVSGATASMLPPIDWK